MKDGIQKSIFLWGVICLIGYAAYYFPWFGKDVIQPLPFWTILTILGIVGMIKWVPNWKKNKVVHVWLAIGVFGLIYHWLFLLGIVPAVIQSPWAYWALLQTIGFALTANWWKDEFWYAVAGLNAVAFLVFMFAPSMIGFTEQSLVLGIVTGLPMIYHGWAVK